VAVSVAVAVAVSVAVAVAVAVLVSDLVTVSVLVGLGDSEGSVSVPPPPLVKKNARAPTTTSSPRIPAIIQPTGELFFGGGAPSTHSMYNTEPRGTQAPGSGFWATMRAAG
jgi:hypothetical protein